MFPDAAGQTVEEKSEQILQDNGGLQQMKNTTKIHASENSVSNGMGPHSLMIFKYTPITSVRAET